MKKIVNFLNRIIQPKESIPVAGGQIEKPNQGKNSLHVEDKGEVEKQINDEVNLKFGHLRER